MNEWLLLLVVGLPFLALWIRVAVEVVRRSDLTAARRLGWIAALVLLPIIGLAAYVVTRNTPGVTRDADDPDSSLAERIVLLAEQRQRGELDDEEFGQQIRTLEIRSPHQEEEPP